MLASSSERRGIHSDGSTLLYPTLLHCVALCIDGGDEMLERNWSRVELESGVGLGEMRWG